jgi:hypothetical protein
MRYKKYNLIEIALSIAILALGLTAIVSLFPLGFQEIGDSIGETYSSMAADSMIAYVAREAYSDWTILDNVPTAEPSTVLTSTTGWTKLEGDIYDPDEGPGIYGLMLTSGDDNSITDFTGEALLWKSKVQNIRAAGETIAELPYDDAAALHLEISWPVEKPYDQRKKNTYYFELFNYN